MMQVRLMFADRDFDLRPAGPASEPALTQDLDLTTLFNAMAREDPFLWEVAQQAVLSSLQDAAAIGYRQAILQDCLYNPGLVRQIYDLAVETLDSERKNYWPIAGLAPDSILRRSLAVLAMLVSRLRQLRNIAAAQADQFTSPGFTAFFARLRTDLGEGFFTEVQDHLRALQFPHGVWISADLGRGNKGAHYVLRQAPDKVPRRAAHLWGQRPAAYTLYIAERDESGALALAELKDRGINPVANVLAQSADQVLHFFSRLRTELAFYVGCLNLQEELARKGAPLCFPVPVAGGARRHSFQGLYDLCLALRVEQRVVGNTAHADQKALVIITGANQGGKSTFLRSIGVAQLLMQCGMLVPAESFCADVCAGLFTHFKRAEDATMTSGKLEEELRRLSAIVDRVTANSLVLLNESWAATNERDGAELARQIVSAFVDAGIRVFFVTHLYDFAQGWYTQHPGNTLFLRAERQSDGTRTFQLCEGAPQETSYGADLYEQIFSPAPPPGPPAAAP